ncbi:MAG: hypothetical protein GPJ54_05210 [Candidatus Heimdallarchaeota archaeon]|nr:hypothetical protein [Candidatus Heimdallarchaeota archaeon]
MVERALITVKSIDPDGESLEEKDPGFDCSWFTSHPGDEIEAKIVLEMRKQQEEVTGDYSFFTSVNGSIVFIRWYAKLNTAVSVVLHIFGENSAIVPVTTWAEYVLKYHISNPTDSQELQNLYRDPKVDTKSETKPSRVSIEYVQYSLEGKEVVIKENTSKEAMMQFVAIIESMPWTVYLLDFARFSGNKMNINFKGGKIAKTFSYEPLYIIITGGTNNKFWDLTYKLLSGLTDIPEDDWFTTIREKIHLIQQITESNQDTKIIFELIMDSVDDILDLDFEYGENFITQCFSDLAIKYPDYNTSKNLLDLASYLAKSNFTDLIKIAEGTALQIAFMLEEANKREEVFLMVTERSKIWGSEHLVGYIQSVTGILSETEENRRILAKIIEASESILNQSWDGALCLVETNVVAGEFKRALELRLQSVNLLTDKFMRAEDAINAVRWAVKIDGLNENDLVTLALPRIGDAFLDIPIGDMFLSNVNSLLDDVIYYDKSKLLSAIITWFSTNLDKIGMSDRLVLLQSLNNRFSLNKKYSQLLVQIRLTLFNHYVESPQEFGYEVAEDLLRLIYNNVDPNKKSSKDLITTITRWIVLAATKFNRPELIEEAKTRYELLLTDKDYARRSLIQIYARAAKNRITLPKSKLRKDGIGAILLEQIHSNAHPINDSQLLMEIIPDAKGLLLKKHAYMLYADYTLLEIELNLNSGEKWLEIAIESTRKLVENGEIEATNIIFQRILDMNLTPEQEITILSAQLDYVEIEPDLINADMIFVKRQKLIELQGASVDDVSEDILLEHYRHGISELMSKGDVTHLNEFLLQAIIFCDKKNLSAIDEFSNILMDSFQTNLDFYRQTKSTDIYTQLIRMFRQINSTFKNRNQTLPIKFANLLIQANLELFNKLENIIFLKRSQLISKEIGFVLREANMKTVGYSEEEKQLLIINVKKVLIELVNKNPVFGSVDAALLASEFFYSINESDQLFQYVDQSLSLLKKGYVYAKLGNSNIIIGLLILSEIYLLIDGEIIKELNSLLQERAIKLIDVGISANGGTEMQKQLKIFKNKMITSPQEAFQEFPFEIENYLVMSGFSN